MTNFETLENKNYAALTENELMVTEGGFVITGAMVGIGVGIFTGAFAVGYAIGQSNKK